MKKLRDTCHHTEYNLCLPPRKSRQIIPWRHLVPQLSHRIVASLERYLGSWRCMSCTCSFPDGHLTTTTIVSSVWIPSFWISICMTSSRVDLRFFFPRRRGGSRSSMWSSSQLPSSLKQLCVATLTSEYLLLLQFCCRA